MTKGKSFKQNLGTESEAAPAMAFITPQAEPERETKSKRLNLLIRPSLFKALTKISVMERGSLNDLINKALAEYVTAHEDQITKYDETFKED